MGIKSIFAAVFFIFILNTAYAGQEPMWGTTPPAGFMIYIVNPELLAGWPSKLYDYEAEYIPEKYKKLPILGSWHNGGGIPDKEMLLKHKVKRAFVISSSRPMIFNDQMYPELKKLNMEVTTMKGDNLTDNIAMLRELGKELNAPERGEALALYAEQAVAKSKAMVGSVAENKKPKVYLAQQSDGLTTSCDFEIIEIAGAKNVFECPKTGAKFSQISFEQIVLMDPDVIVITNPKFSTEVLKYDKWKRLRAYKEGKVYAVPFGPFGWMDKPAVMQIMAAQWLACALYPDKCSINIEKETKEFMKLFLHVDLSDDKIKEIINR